MKARRAIGEDRPTAIEAMEGPGLDDLSLTVATANLERCPVSEGLHALTVFHVTRKVREPLGPGERVAHGGGENSAQRDPEPGTEAVGSPGASGRARNTCARRWRV